MTLYRIRSGELNVWAEADTPQDAVMKAIRQHKPKRLGLVIEIAPEVLFMATVPTLKRMGCFVMEPGKGE